MVIEAIFQNLPDGWNTCTIKETCTNFSMGPFGSDIKKSNFVRMGVPVIRGINLTVPPFYEENFVFLTEKKAYELKSAYAFPEDLIFTHRGTLGQIGMIPENSKFKKYVISQSQMKCTCKKEILQPLFAFYFFSSEYGQKMIFKESTKSGVPHITQPLTTLRQFLIIIPSIPEQKKISQILFDISILINRFEELVQKKKNIQQGTIQKLLTQKRRLFGFDQKWKKIELGKLVTLFTSNSKTKYIEKTGKYLVMDMGSVGMGGENISHKQTNFEGDFLQYGDLVMPKDDIGGGNIIAKTAFVNENQKYILGDHVYALRIKNLKHNSRFLSYIINSNNVNSEMRKKVTGTAQLGISKRTIEEQMISLPTDPEEETAIVKILSDMDSEIKELETKRDKYIMIKQGMMQKLLTGEIRLV